MNKWEGAGRVRIWVLIFTMCRIGVDYLDIVKIWTCKYVLHNDFTFEFVCRLLWIRRWSCYSVWHRMILGVPFVFLRKEESNGWFTNLLTRDKENNNRTYLH